MTNRAQRWSGNSQSPDSLIYTGKRMEHRECDFPSVAAGGHLLAGLSSIEQQPGIHGCTHRIVQILQLYLCGYARHLLHIARQRNRPLVLLCHITIGPIKRQNGVCSGTRENEARVIG